MFDRSELISFTRSSNLPNLGRSQTGAFGSGPRYLLLENEAKPNLRAIRRNDSSDWWAIDQLLNPGSVVLTIGGSFGDRVLIRSEISTTGLSSGSTSLLNAAKRAVAKDFSRVRAFWVGPEALGLLSRGWRLTTNVAAPPEYDLRATD